MASDGRRGKDAPVKRKEPVNYFAAKEGNILLMQGLEFKSQPFRHRGHLIKFIVGHFYSPHSRFRHVESIVGVCQVPGFILFRHDSTVANQLAR